MSYIICFNATGSDSITYVDGHNECVIGYMYDCKLVDASTAEAFIFSYNSMNAHINDNVLFTPSKRIYKGLIK